MQMHIDLLPQSHLHASCVAGGDTIPKGSEIFLNMGYIHKDPKIWDKWRSLDLERVRVRYGHLECQNLAWKDT